MSNERAQLRAFFVRLDDVAARPGGVIAFTPAADIWDQEEGHHHARQLARQRGIDEPNWVFWHKQSGEVFDGSGNLTGPLRLYWGGDYARVLAALQELPEPFEVTGYGEGAAIEVTSTLIDERRADDFPDVADTKAVKDRIRAITAGERWQSEYWSDEEKHFLNQVLIHGDQAAQGYVVRHLAGEDCLTDEAYEVLVDNWLSIYAKAPRDTLASAFLHQMARRQDPRLDEVLDAMCKRTRWTFCGGAGYFLYDRRDPADEERLFVAACKPEKYEHTPGNRKALEGWVLAKAANEGTTPQAVAAANVENPAFGIGSHKLLRSIAERGVLGVTPWDE